MALERRGLRPEGAWGTMRCPFRPSPCPTGFPDIPWPAAVGEVLVGEYQELRHSHLGSGLGAGHSLCSRRVVACRLSLVVASGDYSLLGGCGLCAVVASLVNSRAELMDSRALELQASVDAAHGLSG